MLIELIIALVIILVLRAMAKREREREREFFLLAVARKLECLFESLVVLFNLFMVLF